MKKLDLIIVGVGGQGIVLAGDIIGEAALTAGYDIKKTDTLGMAQRGGSVISHVRLGPEVSSPLINEGEADILIAFEKLEAVRFGYFLRQNGVAIVNNHTIPPLSVNMGTDRYPTDKEITAALAQRTDSIYIVDGTSQAKYLGNIRTLNLLMLGYASVFMPLKMQTWTEAISEHLPEKIRRVNIEAFELGRESIRKCRSLKK